MTMRIGCPMMFKAWGYHNRMPMTADTLARIVEAITTDGYAVSLDFLDAATLAALRERALRLDAGGLLRPAAVRRGGKRFECGDVRGDRIRWLDDEAESAAERSLRSMIDALRVAVNRELQLGLFDLEMHYALYPAGGRYARHVDRFRDDERRVLSIVLYLNDGWREEDGGALRLYLPSNRAIDVLPQGGTLVAFLSERFAHEVLPARWS